MTMGTAMVARTNVRTTVDMVPSQSLRAKLRASSVGKTQSQIITASWWRLGPGGGPDGLVVSVISLLALSMGGSRRGGRGELNGGSNVLVDELGVDRDGHRGAFAGGRDHLRPRVGGVARRPHAGHARAPV